MKVRAYKYRFVILFITLIAFLPHAWSQTDSTIPEQRKGKLKRMFSIGAGMQYGSVFAHSPAVQNTKGSHPFGVEAIIGWQRNDAAAWNLCNCFPRTGLLLAYYDYDNNVLGKSVNAAYFLEPTYRLGKRLFFSFKGVAGLSYLTNPFDSTKNPTNQSYSTKINQYLVVGVGLWLRIADHFWLNPSVNYQHQSNGGLKQPNKGINWPTAGLAVIYQKDPRPYYTGIRTKEKFWRNYSVRWDIGLFGIAKRSLTENQNSSRRLPVVGVSFNGSKQVGRISALSIGTEIFYDEALRVQLKQDSIEASPVRAGILVGHEFLLGKFLFSQRLGVYAFDQTPYYDRLYHRWGIHYRFNKRLGIGFHLLAHRQVAEFIDLRITYSIQRSYELRVMSYE